MPEDSVDANAELVRYFIIGIWYFSVL